MAAHDDTTDLRPVEICIFSLLLVLSSRGNRAHLSPRDTAINVKQTHKNKIIPLLLLGLKEREGEGE